MKRAEKEELRRQRAAERKHQADKKKSEMKINGIVLGDEWCQNCANRSIPAKRIVCRLTGEFKARKASCGDFTRRGK